MATKPRTGEHGLEASASEPLAMTKGKGAASVSTDDKVAAWLGSEPQAEGPAGRRIKNIREAYKNPSYVGQVRAERSPNCEGQTLALRVQRETEAAVSRWTRRQLLHFTNAYSRTQPTFPQGTFNPFRRRLDLGHSGASWSDPSAVAARLQAVGSTCHLAGPLPGTIARSHSAHGRHP